MVSENKPTSVHIILKSSGSTTISKELNALTYNLYTNLLSSHNVQKVQITNATSLPAGAKLAELAFAQQAILQLAPVVISPLMTLLVDWLKERKRRGGSKQAELAAEVEVNNHIVRLTPDMTEADIEQLVQRILHKHNATSGNRYALIIGNSFYFDDRLPRLEAPYNDARELTKLLQSSQIGGFQVVELLDRSAQEIKQAIERLYVNKKQDDLLLLYFSGHGIKNQGNRLHLATVDTEMNQIAQTAVSSQFIQSELRASRSDKKLVLLDCCYSGAFNTPQGAKSARFWQQTVPIEEFSSGGLGEVIVTATDKYQLAWEGERFIGNTNHSIFTHYLLEGLRTGQADRDEDGWIGISELYKYLYDHVTATYPDQKPSLHAINQQGEIYVARNATKSTHRPTKISARQSQPRPEPNVTVHSTHHVPTLTMSHTTPHAVGATTLPIPLPAEIKGWNWGGFLLSGIWAIAHKQYLWAALCFIPYINLAVFIYLGAKGNELAWKSKSWNSIEHFQQVQNQWKIAGIVVFVLFFLLGLGLI